MDEEEAEEHVDSLLVQPEDAAAEAEAAAASA
jgi:hypothetical protein